MGTGKVVGLAGVRRSGKTFLFFDTIRSLLGFSVSKNTLFEYLGYLEDAFLLFLLPRQEQSLRKQAHNPRKLHVIDPGLVAAFKAKSICVMAREAFLSIPAGVLPMPKPGNGSPGRWHWVMRAGRSISGRGKKGRWAIGYG